MKTMTRLLGLALILSLVALPAPAQDDSMAFTGQIFVGYRTVDVGGTENKYKEDINLEKGPRLFNFNFVLQPNGDLKQYVDRVDFTMSNFGGDPFESMHLDVRKYGRYDFRLLHTKSSYFYQDTILPEDPARSREVVAGDFRHFNFDRVRDEAKLGLQLNKAAKFTFDFNRYTKLGTGTWPLDYQRAEIELDRSIDESFNEFTAGFQYAWDKATLVLSEGLRDYSNVFDLFLPGSATSGSTVIDFLFFNQPYDYTSHTHTVQLLAHPNSKFTVKASGIVQNLDLDISASQDSAGLNFQGNPYDVAASSKGSVSRDNDLFDLDLTYLATTKVGLVGGFWYRKATQDGQLPFEGELGTGHWSVKTSGGRAGVQFSPSATVVVTGGVQYETRKANLRNLEPGEDDFHTHDNTTDATGFFADLNWKPNSKFMLTGEAEDSSYDSPYTLKSPTDRQRFRVRGRYNVHKGYYVSGSYLTNIYKNNDSDWDAHYDMANFRLGYQNDDLAATVGWGWIDISRQIDQELSSGQLFMNDYQGTANFYDGQVRWTVNPVWAIGAQARFYTNTGSFGIDRDDERAFVEYTFQSNYVLHVGYRHIKYNEKDYNFDDYDANIAEFSIGYRW
jgi:hypothetical protein